MHFEIIFVMFDECQNFIMIEIFMLLTSCLAITQSTFFFSSLFSYRIYHIHYKLMCVMYYCCDCMMMLQQTWEVDNN